MSKRSIVVGDLNVLLDLVKGCAAIDCDYAVMVHCVFPFRQLHCVEFDLLLLKDYLVRHHNQQIFVSEEAFFDSDAFGNNRLSVSFCWHSDQFDVFVDYFANKLAFFDCDDEPALQSRRNDQFILQIWVV